MYVRGYWVVVEYHVSGFVYKWVEYLGIERFGKFSKSQYPVPQVCMCNVGEGNGSFTKRLCVARRVREPNLV